ncbi:MAG: hypothetical protein M3512_15690 [Bacteroidota bacterium]|nr:hypothetical protein [Bacteroidota bacterium]
MIQKCIKSILPLLFIPYLTYCQIGSFKEEAIFLKHLTQQNLLNERLYLLSNLDDSVDIVRVHFEKAWTFHQLGILDSAALYYDLYQPLEIATDKFFKDYLRLKFILGKHELVNYYLNEDLIDKEEVKSLTITMKMLKLDFKPTDDEVKGVPLDILYSYKSYYKNERKSSILAGAYSALVPGLGKVYIGKKGQGINMFLANAIFGLQAYESYRKSGLNSPRFIIFGSIFSFYYLSNITGSIWGTKKLKRDSKKQFIHDINQYYINDYSLHPHFFQ